MTYLIDSFLTLESGQPFRLFPFGRVVKNGKAREITKEYATNFKLPHFKPPIKLGSHDEVTAAGGHIVGLEIRDDGLYAIPEWNEKGLDAIRAGSFRYHSPEVVWDDGGLENPKSGDYIMGPLIVGDALLHTPHLGEAAAMYTVEPINKEQDMNEETISVPKNFWDKFVAPLLGKSNDQPEPKSEPEGVKPDVYAAVEKERDDYKAKYEAKEAAEALKARVEKYETEIKETKVTTDMAGLLAGLPEDKADLIMKEFRALSAQIGTELETEQGSEGKSTEDPKLAFNALVLKYAAEHKTDYNQAFEIMKAEKPELFAAWAVKKEK